MIKQYLSSNLLNRPRTICYFTSVTTPFQAASHSPAMKWAFSTTRLIAKARKSRSFMFQGIATSKNSGHTLHKCHQNGTRWPLEIRTKSSRCSASPIILKLLSLMSLYRRRLRRAKLTLSSCWTALILIKTNKFRRKLLTSQIRERRS